MGRAVDGSDGQASSLAGPAANRRVAFGRDGKCWGEMQQEAVKIAGAGAGCRVEFARSAQKVGADLPDS